jgi:uncharacterized protein (TIGR02679 family)
MNPTEEAVEYFRRKDDYGRLFPLFAKKIESLGNIGGSVILENPTTTERRAIERWLKNKKSSAGKDEMKIPLKKFEESFKGKRFEGADFYKVVEGVVGRVLVSNKIKKEQSERQREEYFLSLKTKHKCEMVDVLIDFIISKESGAMVFNLAYSKEKFQEIENVIKAISYLPLKVSKRLPIFAEMVTGNPHAFDKEPKLINSLQMLNCNFNDVKYEIIEDKEEETGLLFDFGILRDDLLNFVTCNGLIAEKNGEIIKSWYYACEENMVKNVPLREMQVIDKVYPKVGNTVFVLENSGVYSSILDKNIEEKVIPIICTHGQFKLSGLILIKKLIESGCRVFYSGDFDPDGISMAYRLKKKFGDKVVYWRYTSEDYIESLSEVTISERIQLLNSINDDLLNPLMEKMVKIQRAGYQEKLINKLYNDIME